MPEDENMASCADLVERMKSEMKNPRRDEAVIQDYMERTYAFRRKLINECAPVKTINSEYPALKLPFVIKQEMSMVLQKDDCLTVFKNNVMQFSAGFLDLATKKPDETVSKLIKEMIDVKDELDEMIPAEVSRIGATTSIIQLPSILKAKHTRYICLCIRIFYVDKSVLITKIMKPVFSVFLFVRYSLMRSKQCGPDQTVHI